MSHPNDLVPPAPPLPAVPVVEPAPASPIEEPMPSGAPYRAPAPPPPQLFEAPPAELYFGRPSRKPRPLIGPALSVFAVTLWAFVVAGQFASSWSMGINVLSGHALIVVAFLTFVAWIANMRRSRAVVPPRSVMHLLWRAIGAGILAFLLFLFSLAAATAVNSAMDVDFFAALALVLVSLGAAIAGPHLTSPSPVVRTPRQRTTLVLLWVAGTLLTLIAGADLAAHG